MRWLVANWKMNLSVSEAEGFFRELPTETLRYPGVTLGVAPMAPLIPVIGQAAKSAGITLGAQNAHWEDSGAFTGEVSVTLLKELGCDFVIVGHSERRHVFRETADEAAKRGAKVLTSGMTALFCIGETLPEREGGKTNEVLTEQLSPLISRWKDEFAPHLVIAYEPVWAIGTGKTATSDQIKDAHAFVGEYLEHKTGVKNPPILYGGSVTPENAAEILSLPRVAGALVGRASLKADSFAELCRAAAVR